MQRPNCEHGRPSACCFHWCAIVVVVVVVMVVIEASKQASKQAFQESRPHVQDGHGSYLFVCRCGSVFRASSVRKSGSVRTVRRFARFAGSHSSAEIGNCHENGCRESCGEAKQCILHRISVRIIS